MAPASNSQTSASPEPLCSPNGSTTPRGWVYMTAGLVVGLPAWSSSAPSIIGLPALWATLTLPSATRLVAKSSRIGSLLAVGGNRDADRIGQEPPLAAAERRHAGRAGGDVDEVQRHHAGARGDLAIRADAADMVRVAQAIHCNAVLPGRADRPFDRLARDHLAIAGMRIPHRDRAGIGDNLGRLVDLQRACLEVAHIGDQHADAMAVMATQIGLDQVLGHDRGFRGRAAAGRDDAIGKREQFGVVDDHSLSPLRSNAA